MRNSTSSTETTTVTMTVVVTPSPTISGIIHTTETAQNKAGVIAIGVIAGIEGAVLLVCALLFFLSRRAKAKGRVVSGYISPDQGNWDNTHNVEQNLLSADFPDWEADLPQGKLKTTQGRKSHVSDTSECCLRNEVYVPITVHSIVAEAQRCLSRQPEA